MSESSRGALNIDDVPFVFGVFEAMLCISHSQVDEFAVKEAEQEGVVFLTPFRLTPACFTLPLFVSAATKQRGGGTQCSAPHIGPLGLL